MTSNCSKTVRIEKAELDHLQEWQLCDYSPKLQTIARLQNEISDIIVRKKSSAEKRFNIILDIQIKFNKLKEETQMLSGTLPA